MCTACVVGKKKSTRVRKSRVRLILYYREPLDQQAFFLLSFCFLFFNLAEILDAYPAGWTLQYMMVTIKKLKVNQENEQQNSRDWQSFNACS